MGKNKEVIQKIVELKDEMQLKQRLNEIENKAIQEQLELIMKVADLDNFNQAYNLLKKYKGIWEFTANVSTSGDSFTITLPKKEAKDKGIEKGSPVLLALRKLRFYSRDKTN